MRLQQDFTLQEAYTTPTGQRIQAIRYRADFTYRVAGALYEIPCCVSFEDLDFWNQAREVSGKGTRIIEDVKTLGTKTKTYAMKRKMMADRGYIIREV